MPDNQTNSASASSTRRLLLVLVVAVLLLGALPFLLRSPSAPLSVTPTMAPTATSLTAAPTFAPTAALTSPTTGTSVAPTTAVSVATATATTAAPSGANAASETLAAIEHAHVPARDLYTLTGEVKLHTAVPLPRMTGRPAAPLSLGARQVFQVGDTTNGSYYPVTATLRIITPHAYWWVDDANPVDVTALRGSADRFETKIYPGDRSTFGEPPDPGVDGDSHINVLNTPISGAAGYFSAADMYTRAVNPFSNQRKMIYAGVEPGGGAYEGLLAHEFQHMIHWNVHPNQDIWINEGMSELAMKINGYDTGSPETVFESNPGVQLNHWASPPKAAIPHYGAAYLFLDYLYGRYGAGIIRSVMLAPGAGTNAVDGALAAQGRTERFADVFRDWALANWLDKTTAVKLYQYTNLQVQAEARATLSGSTAVYSGTLHEQAADYLVIPSGQGRTLSLNGDATVPLISTRPHSGNRLWWSNRGDVSAPNLTRALDLSGARKATLSYWTWYDIEEGFDYAYTEVSHDNGATWDTLAADGTTDANPNGNNLGHGYTGRSGGSEPAWIRQQVDLTPYAGQRVLLRFQYVTDDGLNLQGFAVDDIQVPEIGYYDDAEAAGANGWTAQGFVHVDPVLPQQFIAELITYAADGAASVRALPLDAANHGEIDLPAGNARAVLMVAALAPATTWSGHYRVSIR